MQEVSAAVAARLEGQLVEAVRGGLDRPLQEAFRDSFGRQLLPAFEKATQATFQQVDAALTAGVQEHLQASGC